MESFNTLTERLLTFGQGQVVPEDEEREEGQGPPIRPLYARDPAFWQQLLFLFALAILHGLVAFVFVFTTERVLAKWLKDDEGNRVSQIDFFHGEWYWLAITAGGGLLVGIIKVVLDLPYGIQGIFKIMQDENATLHSGLKVFVASWISLLAGTPLSPEIALIPFSAGLTHELSSKLSIGVDYMKQNVFNGIAAGISPLFPSPLVGLISLVEVRHGIVEKEYMRDILLLIVSTVTSFLAFYVLFDDAFLPIIDTGYEYRFHLFDAVKAIIIGLLSGVFALVYNFIGCVMSWTFSKFGNILPNQNWSTLLIATVGGALVGLCGVCVPISIGPTALETKQLFVDVFDEEDFWHFFGIAFFKALATAISLSSGFVGGNLFPLIFIGAACGIGSYKFVGDGEILPLLLSVSCFTGGVVASITPVPISMALLSLFLYKLSAYQAIPVLISCAFAHLLTGMVHYGCRALIRRFTD